MKPTRTIKDRLADMRPIAGGSAEEIRQSTRDMLIADVAKGVREALSVRGRQDRPEIYDVGSGIFDGSSKSIGEIFIESDAYKSLRSRFSGGIPEGAIVETDPVSVSHVLRAATIGSRTGMRTLVTGAPDSAGGLSPAKMLGLIEPGQVAPQRIRELLNVIPTESSEIEYVKETSRADNAAPVPEATQVAHVGNEVATKPEGGIAFAVVREQIRTIAQHVPVTTKVLADSPVLSMYIDDYLISSIGKEIEEQVLAGVGTGENFRGILNTPGIQTLGAPAAPASNLDNIRKAITQIVLNATTEPNAVAFNPTDWQNIELLKIGGEANRFVGGNPFESGPRTVWGVSVVESPVIPVGTALVGDFKKAVLFDRQEAQIAVGTINDQLIRNQRTVLAEVRAGFGVLRPPAFCRVTLA